MQVLKNRTPLDFRTIWAKFGTESPQPHVRLRLTESNEIYEAKGTLYPLTQMTSYPVLYSYDLIRVKTRYRVENFTND